MYTEMINTGIFYQFNNKELENRVLWFDYNIMENQRVLSLLKEKAQRTILQIDKYLGD